MKEDIRKILIVDDNHDFRRALLVRLSGLFPNADIVEYDFFIQELPSTDFMSIVKLTSLNY